MYPPVQRQDMESRHPPASEHTHSRLIEAAAKVFAEKGYFGATLREICRLAQANNAAINYHFRDKRHLYIAVIDYISVAGTDFFPLSQPDSTVSPEDQLRVFIQLLLNKLFMHDQMPTLHHLIVHEMANPSPAIDYLAEKVIRPTYFRLRRIVAQILEADADSQRVNECAFSIISQCVNYYFSRTIVPYLGLYAQFDEAALTRLADHIAEFSLSALRAMKRSSPISSASAAG